MGHVAESEWSYVSATLGTVPGGSSIMTAIKSAGESPWGALIVEREALMVRLREMTPEEMTKIVDRGEGKPVRSAQRMLRRMLEHEWEHVLELKARVVA